MSRKTASLIRAITSALLDVRHNEKINNRELVQHTTEALTGFVDMELDRRTKKAKEQERVISEFLTASSKFVELFPEPERKVLAVDANIREAVEAWISHGLDPGSCTRLLLEGKYDEAFQHAHPLIKPHWEDHVAYIKTLSEECRGENMESWKKKFEKEE